MNKMQMKIQMQIQWKVDIGILKEKNLKKEKRFNQYGGLPNKEKYILFQKYLI